MAQITNPTQIASTEEEQQAVYDAQLADLQYSQQQQLEALQSAYGASGLSTSGAYLGPEGALPELYSSQTRDLGTIMSNYNLSAEQAQQDAQLAQAQLLQGYLQQGIGLGQSQVGVEQQGISNAYNDYLRMLQQPLTGLPYAQQLGNAQTQFYTYPTEMAYSDWLNQQSGIQSSLQNATSLLSILGGQANSQYQSDLSNYQNQQQGQSNFYSGLGQLGTSLMTPYLYRNAGFTSMPRTGGRR